MSGDDFLSRWSRRKLETRREENLLPPADIPPPDTSVEESGPALTPEELAALPKVEELTPETDITVFLRKGVPETLKNAALRRMWSLDPAVRDYVGDAREYAYDWNVPGGVPGNGPLLPTDNVAELSQTFSDGPTKVGAAAAADEVPRGPLSQEGEPEIDGRGSGSAGDESETVDAAQHPEQAREPEPPAGAQGMGALPRLQTDRGGLPADAAVHPAQEQAPDSAPNRRRHGGAQPV